jgi:hypothetical protein
LGAGTDGADPEPPVAPTEAYLGQCGFFMYRGTAALALHRKLRQICHVHIKHDGSLVDCDLKKI